MRRSTLAGGVSLALVLGAASACADRDRAGLELTLAPEAVLPSFVRGAPTVVRDAYRFAVANPDVLRAIPCYCGCGGLGHHSNLDCYVREVGADSPITFDSHAYG